MLEHVPRDVTLTVTASPVKGLEHTLELGGRARGARVPGRAAPLRAARRRPRAPRASSSRGWRRWACATSSSSPAMPTQPAGAFERRGAAPRRDGTSSAIRSSRSGSPGYPESHPLIDDETTIAAMFEKARHATYIASQICFDSRVTVAWIDNVWARGTRLPILVGIPGVVPRAKLAARLDADRDRRVAPLPAQARRLRDAVPAARRLQPGPADQGPRAGARRPGAEGRRASTSSPSTTSPTPRRGGSGSSPADRSVSDHEAGDDRYDVVIVGGGSAGCALANRLSADPSTRVLVLEAGRPDYKWDVFIHMPAGLATPIGNRFYDWKYESEPEPHMNGRRIYHARGKVLGGSSSINGMIFQRGNPLDYERWGADPGMGTLGLRALPPVLQADGELPRRRRRVPGRRRPARARARPGDEPAVRGVLRGGAAGGLPAHRRRQRLQAGGLRRLRPQHPPRPPAQRGARVPPSGHAPAEPRGALPRVREPGALRRHAGGRGRGGGAGRARSGSRPAR